MGKIFGIDLGTTYSCIAYVDPLTGQPSMIRNEENNNPITASVVYFGSESDFLVGDLAKESLSTDPENVCSVVKRQMGNEEWFFSSYGVQRRAEEISALILKRLAMDASQQLGEEVKDVVITCPAYFGIKEREATIAAGELAGLNVLKVINEPTAAACAYGLDTDKKETILVYDLGGGTFDVTIIDVDPGKLISVVVTGGDHNLGGKDWDEILRTKFIDAFNFETGNSDNILEDPETAGDLELKAETAKKTLSKMLKTNVNVVHNGEKVKVEVSRDEFDMLTKSLLDTTIEMTRLTIEEAKNKLGHEVNIDKIIMVGGSTKMPQIKDRLQAEFANIPVDVIDPDESVAKGAAMVGINIAAYNIQAGWEDETNPDNPNPNPNPDPIYGLGGTQGGKPMDFRDVISKSFGVELQVDDEGTLKVVNVIPKNTNIPTNITLNARTLYKNQTAINIRIFENEVSDKTIDADRCTFLGEDQITGLPENLPLGSPVEIKFTITENGTLEVMATETTGNNSIFLDFDIKGAMTKEEKEEATQRVGGMKYMA